MAGPGRAVDVVHPVPEPDRVAGAPKLVPVLGPDASAAGSDALHRPAERPTAMAMVSINMIMSMLMNSIIRIMITSDPM